MAHCKSVADFSLSFTSVKCMNGCIKNRVFIALNFCFFLSFFLFFFRFLILTRKERKEEAEICRIFIGLLRNNLKEGEKGE